MNVDFIFHGNITFTLHYITLHYVVTRYYCNYDSLHLNDKDATLFNENILSTLNKVA